jgi:hypothetical protein
VEAAPALTAADEKSLKLKMLSDILAKQVFVYFLRLFSLYCVIFVFVFYLFSSCFESVFQ